MLSSVKWTGAVLIALGASIFAWKVLVARVPLTPAQGERLWRVELEISVRGRGQRGSVRAALPSTEPGQRIMDEGVVSQQLDHSVRNEPGGRVAVWGGRLDGMVELRQAYRVELQRVEMSLPTTPMPKVPEDIAQNFLISTATVPAKSREIASLLRSLSLATPDDPAGSVRTIFAFVANEVSLDNEESDDALIALAHRVGDPVGKARLLTAMLRASGIPARRVQGLELQDDGRPRPKTWVEAWIGEWVPMSPEDAVLGLRPARWLALSRDEGPTLSSTSTNAIDARHQARREWLGHDELATLMTPPNAIASRFSLFRLPLATQAALRVLLLLPIGALGIAVLRNVVGIRTFGTFTPILFALALRVTDLATGMGLVFSVAGLGLLSRLLLGRLHLLLVPRLCVLLCVVVLGLAGLALLGRESEVSAFFGGSLLPVVILVMLVERFTVTLQEEGARHALTRLAWTFGVAAMIHPILQSALLDHWMFGFPELVLVVAGLLIWVGGYTGYRLSELMRFRSFAAAPAQAGPGGAA